LIHKGLVRRGGGCASSLLRGLPDCLYGLMDVV